MILRRPVKQESSRVNGMSDRTNRIKVVRWGPFPRRRGVFGGGIGGYARYNSQALRSVLAKEVSLIAVPMTVPKFVGTLLPQLHLVVRMLEDIMVITVALVLRRPAVLHITALYWRSIYREAYAVWLAKRLGVAVFYDVRAGTFDRFVTRSSRVSLALTRYVMRSADAIAVQGRGLVDFVEKEFGREASWLPNCFLNRDMEQGCPAQLTRPVEGEPYRLVYLGYLIPEKGVDVLLRAAERLGAEFPVRVTLIGELAPRFAQTLNRFRERQTEQFAIECTGRLELEQLLDVLRQQHLFVFLSRFFGEGHPNAVNEAMAVGLPVVASRNGFLGDVIDENSGVFVNEPQNVKEVCGVLTELYRDWDRLRSLGEGARKRITNEFGEDDVLGRTAQIYRHCAGATE